MLVVVGFVAYFPSFQNGPLIDDYSLIVNQSATSGWQNFQRAVTPSSLTNKHYRPIVKGVIALLGPLLKTNFFAYRIFCLVLFLGFCLLMRAFVCRLYQNNSLAWLASFLFCVHPINVMTAGYVTGGLTCLYGLFMLLCSLCYLNWKETKKLTYILLGIVFYALAMLSHEIGIFMPMYLLMLSLYIEKKARVGFADVFIISSLILGALYVLMRMRFVSLANQVFLPFVHSPFDFISYLANFGRLVRWYFSRLVFLNGITFIWSQPVCEVSFGRGMFNIVLVGMGLGSVCWFYRKRKGVLLALFFLGAGFLPAMLASVTMLYLGIIIEPHWFYFSSIGFFIVLAQGLQYVIRKAGRIPAGLIVIMILCLWGSVTWQYNVRWASQKAFMEDWLWLSPNNPSAHFYLGDSYLRVEKLQQAEDHFEKSMTGTALDAQAFVNLGVIALELGRVQEAEKDFLHAIERNPKDAVAYNDLGLVYMRLKQQDTAFLAFEKARSLNPSLSEPRLNLAQIYRQNGKFDQAAELYLENLKMNPYEFNSRLGLVQILLILGAKQQAVLQAGKMIPACRDAEMLTVLGSHLASAGLNAPAERAFTQAIAINSDFQAGYLELGKLFGNQGRFDKAREVWQTGLALDPSNRSFIRLLERANALEHGED